MKETKSNTMQQEPTKSTSVEWKKRNAENKRKSRRGFLVHKNNEGAFTHNAVQIGRNEPCHCGSGMKFKKCHLEKQRIVQTS